MNIKIYMKSGNTIMQKGVEEYNYRYTSDRIVSLTIKLSNPWYKRFVNKLIGRNVKKVLVPSIDLRQIEAIEVV